MTINASKPVNRIAKHFDEGLEDRICESAVYVAGALLRMLERRQQRCEALVHELELIEQELTAQFNEKPATEATPEPSADGSGVNNTKLTANAAADNEPVPVLLIDLLSFDMVLGWIV